MLTRRRFAQLSAAVAAAGCSGGAPDIIIHGGPIYTGVAAMPRVDAVRISGGRFTLAGALSDARSGGLAREIDLGGAAAFPGFMDSHAHLTAVGMAALQLDLVGAPSLAALQQALGAYARAHPGRPILGRGWIETHWPERRFPTRADLDAVVSDQPVLLGRIDGHAAVANSAALSLAGIDAATPNPEGGRIERDAAGVATGMLIDNAEALVASRMPAPDAAARREALRQAVDLYAQRGWTAACFMSANAEDVQFLQDFAARDELPLRVDLYLAPEESDALFARGPSGEGRVHVRGVKLYMDGALGSRGAALLAPYADARSEGLLVTPVETLRGYLRRAREGGLQVATHAIGDRGNRLVLDAYRDVFADDPAALAAARWRIEHAQVIDPLDIPRFAQMGVIASMQPSHAISDLHFAPARLGQSRLGGAYAWRALLASGAVIAAGSDAPVERGDPLIEFYAAAYRRDLQGFAGPDWRADEAVTRFEALRMLTWGGAFSVFQEAERGVIAPGRVASLSAFSADLMTAQPAAIPGARAVLAICDGAITHQAL
ncbi:MAG: amidohydrolase [Hyphomonadaceae bacterium]|nr:amidohydrolase [Hyphomonadaceae bacterium]